MAQEDSFKTAMYCLFGGGAYFYYGLKAFKLRRTMADTPTSKIASAAIGKNVEIVGKVKCTLEDQIISPLTQKKGYAFVWHLEQFVRQRKNSRWVTIHHYYSSPYIYLHDGGEALAALDLASCEFNNNIYRHTTEFSDKDFNLPTGVKLLLNNSGVLDTEKKKGFFTSSNFRISERVFGSQEMFYVLGTAHIPPKKEHSSVLEGNTFGKRAPNLRQKIAGKYRELLKNPKIILRFDKNKNATLDKDEMDLIYLALEKKIMAEYSNKTENHYLEASKIFFSMDPDARGIFDSKKVFVSCTPEGNTTSQISLKAYAGVFGGPILIVIGLLILVS